MVEHNFEQLSPEWFAMRVGKLTGSKFMDLMPSDKAKTEWTQTQSALLVEVASEILTGKAQETFSSKAMEWGIEKEDEARAALSDYYMSPIRECGFFEYSEWAGASPDGILGDNEMTIELKCPLSKTHMSYYLDSELLWKKYRWQVVGETLCTGIDKGVIASYDPRFPEGKQLVVHDPGDLSADREKLKARIDSAVELIKEWVK